MWCSMLLKALLMHFHHLSIQIKPQFIIIKNIFSVCHNFIEKISYFYWLFYFKNKLFWLPKNLSFQLLETSAQPHTVESWSCMRNSKLCNFLFLKVLPEGFFSTAVSITAAGWCSIIFCFANFWELIYVIVILDRKKKGGGNSYIL